MALETTVINDPVALKSYRNQILERKGELQNSIARTQSALDEVHQTWNDEQYQQFAQNFNDDLENIAKLCESLQYYDDPILANLQRKLEAYLAISMSR